MLLNLLNILFYFFASNSSLDLKSVLSERQRTSTTERHLGTEWHRPLSTRLKEEIPLVLINLTFLQDICNVSRNRTTCASSLE